MNYINKLKNFIDSKEKILDIEEEFLDIEKKKIAKLLVELENIKIKILSYNSKFEIKKNPKNNFNQIILLISAFIISIIGIIIFFFNKN